MLAKLKKLKQPSNSMNSAIATKLNVLESAIVRVEEWAHVLFVVVKGLGARFVSKKIVEKKMTKVEVANKVVAFIGGKVWVGGDIVRVYLAHRNGGYVGVGKSGLNFSAAKNAHGEYSELRAAGLLEYAECIEVSAAVVAPARSRSTCLNCDLSTSTLLGRGFCTDCYGEC